MSRTPFIESGTDKSGTRSAFETTQWSVVLAAGQENDTTRANAALEASREDHGRYDIALVAGEIRTLLARSESATRELHALLNDTVHKIEAGALLVEEVGLTLARSAGAVRQVTEILSGMGCESGPAANTPLHADAGAD